MGLGASSCLRPLKTHVYVLCTRKYMCVQDLCHDNQADVQEGLVHFFPALLQHLPHTARASFFQTLTQSLSLESSTWRCRIGLADQLDSLSALEVRQLIDSLHGHHAMLNRCHVPGWAPSQLTWFRKQPSDVCC